ncbi:MAG: alcohol dehydrogenase catalytic domain-containing protein [Erysipelotrichaceae bacterium]|nr:alcohol dehydrogenase catalytic domain-containing protein [Erysipelotrichaceae bacterium]
MNLANTNKNYLYFVEVKEIDKPIAKVVIIKVVKANICGTDVGAYINGGYAVGIYPGNQLGHEFVGRIVEVGSEVKDLAIGQRVTVNPTSRIPLSCDMNSTEIADMFGAFFEYVYVEETQKISMCLYYLKYYLMMQLF